MSGTQKLESLRNLIEENLHKVVSAIPSPSLRDPISSLLATGKRVRPLVTLICTEVAGGSALHAVHAAMGVELLHAASLVHDDIMDSASLRRGRPTLHAAHGVNIALLCGDYLVALAYEQMFRVRREEAREEVLALTNATYKVLCEGQALEEWLTRDAQPEGESVLEVIEKKTASLMELAARLGAVLGGAEYNVTQALGQFGKMFGIAFQIQDDILDVMGCEKETGKDHLLDARNRKTTSVRAASTDDFVGGGSGGLMTARHQCEKYVVKAHSALAAIPISEARGRLAGFVSSLMDRRT